MRVFEAANKMALVGEFSYQSDFSKGILFISQDDKRLFKADFSDILTKITTEIAREIMRKMHFLTVMK